jgi:hypothetical protein
MVCAAQKSRFRLSERTKGGPRPEGLRTLRNAAADDPVVRRIFNMPVCHYLLWAYPLAQDRSQTAGQAARYEELYELCCYLLKTYDGTRKTFYLGHWEGDLELRGKAGSRDDPTKESIANKTRWLNRRQQAVDDAKRDTPHHRVDALCYAEANKVRDSMQGRPSMANEVIPHTQIDFVSYSSYETANGKDAGTEVPKALDYLESKLPPKPAIQGKRVWIGEYGYPACRYSPQDQAARSRQLMQTARQWGCPLVLCWEMYNNEVDKGVKQPVYYLH